MKHKKVIYLPAPAGGPAMFPMPPNGAELRMHQMQSKDGRIVAALIGWAVDEGYFLPLAENFAEAVEEEVTADMVPETSLEGVHGISKHVEGSHA